MASIKIIARFPSIQLAMSKQISLSNVKTLRYSGKLNFDAMRSFLCSIKFDYLLFLLRWHFSYKLPSTALLRPTLYFILILHALPFENHQLVLHIYGLGMFKFRKLTFLY